MSSSRAEDLIERYEVTEVPEQIPRLFEAKTVVLAVLLGLLGAIIGLELQTRVGITPNTSIVGALIALALARIPSEVFATFRDTARQNLMQTVISGATFGGANAILVPAGIIWLVGGPELVPAMLAGAALGLLIDATMLYRLFDTRIFPARGTWPQGVAAAECIIAGDRGGKRARLLGLGGLAGATGKFFGIPMEIFGVAWIGNASAIAALGTGLLLRAYSPALFAVDIKEWYMPHGVMIGAGVVALLQIAVSILGNGKRTHRDEGNKPATPGFIGSLAGGYGAFVLAASLLAFSSGLYAEMPFEQLVGFVLFAALAALCSELIVGIAAMHSGWFPAFATTLIFLVLGMLLGFKGVPLALLAGFTASTGPAFADMGYDLKSGWILRGSGRFAGYEGLGRRQQYYAELLGFTIAAAFTAFIFKVYFNADLLPPVDRVFASTIEAGADSGIARYLLIWALPGALIQLAGGSARQLGVLFATGMLILNPAAGWTVFAALSVRAILKRRYGANFDGVLHILAGGFIAGSALCSFGTATLRAR